MSTFSHFSWDIDRTKVIGASCKRLTSHPSMTTAASDLSRFVDAQQNSYELPKRELIAGHKTSHWIWWTLPQIQKREKTSTNNIFYAIKSLEEAKAYLQHPVLGPRLIEMSEIILSHRDGDVDYIMGKRCDTNKLQSCVFLFSMVSGPGSVFERVLAHFFWRCEVRDYNRSNVARCLNSCCRTIKKTIWLHL
jgi:uncharacterized protein (DUF1810 family)